MGSFALAGLRCEQDNFSLISGIERSEGQYVGTELKRHGEVTYGRYPD